ncbi:MAG: hypothetical protein HY052_03505 [Proteobacteria bacterium]|nr:hypothetical protein [Pseudomonadota bacterium]
MAITLDALDGQYEVRSEANHGGPFLLKGDGITVVKNGLTYRKDQKGCIWESAFSVIGNNKVQIESTVDPSHAGDDVYISDENGNPTKCIVTYRSVLNAQSVNGKVVLSGEIKHGAEITHLTMTQL